MRVDLRKGTVRTLTVLSASMVAGCVCRSPLTAHRVSDAASAPFTVVHKAPTGRPLAHAPFRYMHYYRTEVRNLSARPLKIVWFEGFGEEEGTWHSNNVLGRVLREEEFSAWYAEGDTITHGVIPPRSTAVCDVNWHGSNSSEPMRVKWALIAVDESGDDYYVEAVVEPSVVERVDHGADDDSGAGDDARSSADSIRSAPSGASRSSPAPTP